MEKFKREAKYFYEKNIAPRIAGVWFYWICTLAEFAKISGTAWEKLTWMLPHAIREKRACNVWVKSGVIYSIIKVEMPEWDRLPSGAKKLLQKNWFCGYARFRECPWLVPAPRTHDISFDKLKEMDFESRFANYIPVHGGITFERAELGGYTIGFDCNHLHDETREYLRDKEWLLNQIHSMRRAIDVAINERFEQEYFLNPSKESREDVLQRFETRLEEEGIEQDYSTNFSAMINILFGSL